MKFNPLTLIDYYKADHRRQYPEGTILVFSNFTPRKSRVEGVNKLVFFGLQYFIKEYLITGWNEEFFQKDKAEVIKKYKRRLDNSLGKDAIDVSHIEALHDLGYMPISIMALPEGSVVDMKVPPFVLWNTKPEFFWLVNYLETIISCTVWQASTSATLAKEFKKIFNEAALKTTGTTDGVNFQGHDFSFRGMSSPESAVLSGAGHLLFFDGTDTVPAIDFLEEYYGADTDTSPFGFSIPATEHSVMCMGGKDNEIGTFERLLNLYPTGLLGVVSDTWNLWTVLTNYLVTLKKKILARKGRLVIRPDSGDPVDIICGKFPFFGTGETAEDKGVVELLWDVFGGTVNELGYKILDPHIGCIYGDGISMQRARDINARLEAKGFASINWVAGIGSYTYQYNTRDTFGWAMKATYGEVITNVKRTNPHGESYYEEVLQAREIFKDPITDDGMKKSAKGLIAVYDENGQYLMKDQATWEQVKHCAYEYAFLNGTIMNNQKFDEIRKIANK